MENLPTRHSAYTTKVCIPLFLTTRPLSAKYQVNSLPSFIWSSLEYMTLDIQKKRCASLCIASYTFQLPSICLLRTALKKFCSNNGGLLAGTSWHFLEHREEDITTLWVYGSTSFDINRADGMLSSNAKCISRDNVTCFGSNKCPWSRGHLSWCFKCSSLLACKGSNWAVFFLDVPVPVHWIHA